MNKIGLIAGNGRFPLLFAQAAKKKGLEVVCVAIEEEADKKISEYADKVLWVKLGDFLEIFSILKQENISRAVMVGQIKKVHIFNSNLKLDSAAAEILKTVADHRDSPILSAVIEKLKSEGIEVISSATFLEEFLPAEGVLTRRHPTPKEKADIDFGFQIARELARLDIGQTIIVKDRVVVAIEAVEGTDEAIRRAKALAGGDLVVIKVARPLQDMRFDIPVIGINTIETLKAADSNVLAVESKKTLLIDKEELIDFADKNNISIVSI